jgi:Ca2+-binding RTX toxin-like protein
LLDAIAQFQLFTSDPFYNAFFSNTAQRGSGDGDTIIAMSGTVRSLGGDDLVFSDGIVTVMGGKGDDILMSGTSLYGGDGNDRIFVTEDIGALAKGGKGDDLLQLNNSQQSTLFGNKGDDLLFAGSQGGTLYGGQGEDFFAFNGTEGIDILGDFKPKDDMIGLRFNSFDNMKIGILADAAFVVGTEAVTPEQRIIYNKTNGALLYDQDGSLGVYAPIQIATLPHLPNLHASNIVVGYNFGDTV